MSWPFQGAYDLRPDLVRLPPRHSCAWRELAAEVLAEHAARGPRGGRWQVVHPDDSQANAFLAYVRSGEFTSDDVAEPRVREMVWRGRTFTLLEEPRPAEVELVRG